MFEKGKGLLLGVAAVVAVSCGPKENNEIHLNDVTLPEARLTPLQAQIAERFPNNWQRTLAEKVVNKFGEPVEKLSVEKIKIDSLDAMFGRGWVNGDYYRVRNPGVSSYFYTQNYQLTGHLERDVSKRNMWKAYATLNEHGFDASRDYADVKVTNDNQFQVQRVHFKNTEHENAHTAWHADNSYIMNAGSDTFQKSEDRTIYDKVMDGKPGTTIFVIDTSEKVGDKTKYFGTLEIHGLKNPEYLGDGAYSNRHGLRVECIGTSIERIKEFTVSAYWAAMDREDLAVLRKMRPNLKFVVAPAEKEDSLD